MKKGSYTVEAALLMGILIPLLAGVIYTGFYLMEKNAVYGRALEQALTKALTGEEADEEIYVSLEKTIPGFPFGRTFFSIPDHVKGDWTLKRKNPTKTVFALHSAKKVIRQVKKE